MVMDTIELGAAEHDRHPIFNMKVSHSAPIVGLDNFLLAWSGYSC